MPRSYTTTTPIYYVNSLPHIGTALTTFASDVIARYMRMKGLKTHFMTGTDENGIKVMEAAEKANKSPQEFVDHIAIEFKKIWDEMHIHYDDFIRTTESRHKEAVYELFRILKEAGFVYLGKYEGWYDVSSETFYKETDLIEGKSPDGNPVRWIEEENWFFKLSAFTEKLKEYIIHHPEFILPETRRNEVLSFIDQGLRDVCISRTGQKWGISIPDDPSRVFYVWFEALINYLASCGWPNKNWTDKWPADVQWMGKDILTRFHATLWPAMLMGAELPLPKTLVGHGWVLMGGHKVSKSKGNVIAPMELAKELQELVGCELDLAIDAVRHYMGVTMPYDSDYTFTYEDFEKRYNADLANDLGNALNRSLAMCHKFIAGIVPEAPLEEAATQAIALVKKNYEKAMEQFRIDMAVDAAIQLVRFLNKYIDDRAPWTLSKNQDPVLGSVLRSMLVVLRTIGSLVSPIMPKTALSIANQLNLESCVKWDQIGLPETMPVGHHLGHPIPMFPRIDLKGKTRRLGETAVSFEESSAQPKSLFIEFDDFKKVKLQVGRVLEAEAIPKSKKLIRTVIQIGEEKRQVLAGIKESYSAESLLDKQVIVVTNLKPVKIMGLESCGMILAADSLDGKAIIISPEQTAPEGAEVH